MYILRVACPWRDLPADFGCWSTVYSRWRRWTNAGLWAEILDLLIEESEGQLRFLDSTHIKVHQDGSNPAGGQEQQSMGRTKGGLNSKITALVDSRGRAIQLTVTEGNMADVKAAETIVIPSEKRLVADKGYDSDGLREEIAKSGANYCIPPRKTRVKPVHWHRGYYRLRHRVENFFQRIKPVFDSLLYKFVGKCRIHWHF